MNKTKDFLDLIKANPDLPVIPMVSAACVAGYDGDYSVSDFGNSEVTEYTVVDLGDGEEFYTRSDQWEIEDYIAEQLAEEEGNLSQKEITERARQKAKSLEWKKAIIVYIERQPAKAGE